MMVSVCMSFEKFQVHCKYVMPIGSPSVAPCNLDQDLSFGSKFCFFDHDVSENPEYLAKTEKSTSRFLIFFKVYENLLETS